MTVESSFDS